MKKKSKKTHKPLKYRKLFFLFFFVIFSIFFKISYSQHHVPAYDSLLTNDFFTDSLKSEDLFEKGLVAFSKKDDQTALEYFNKAYFIRKNIYGNDNINVVYPLMRAGVAYKELGRLNEAIECYLEAERVYKINFGNDSYMLGAPYSNLGNVYKQKGNFSDAINYHEMAIERLKLGDTTNVRVQNMIYGTEYNLAENLVLTKHYEKALNLIFSSYKNSPYYYKASFLGLLGNIYFELNELYEAKKYYILSIEELKKNMQDAFDSTDLADLYIVYSDFLIRAGYYSEAYSNLSNVLPLLHGANSGIDISNSYYTFGNLYAKKQFDSNSLSNFRNKKIKNLDSALIYYQKAIIALSDNFTNQAPSSNPLIEQCKFPSNTLRILQSKAETYFELAQLRQDDHEQKLIDLENSLSASKLASDLLNNLRTGTVSEESKIVMTQLQNSIYLFSIKVAYELFSISGKSEYFETAFMNAERNKAASLLDNLTDENARQGSFLPDSLVQKEENINDRISFITQKLFEENQQKHSDSLKIVQYEDQLFQLNHDKNELERFLEKNFSDYYRLKYTDDNITVSSIQKLLRKDEVILEYVYEKAISPERSNYLYLFWVSKKEFNLQRTRVDEDYLKEIDTVYKFLSASDYINIPATDYINYLHSAYALYEILVKPVEKQIANKSITIIPDGKLSYIPFDALLSNIPEVIDTLNFKDLDYLVRKFSFNYSYSANLYLNRFNTEKRAPKKLLAFAPDYGDYIDYADNEYNSLAPLAGIKQEVESIAGYIKSDTFIGKKATESNFLNNYADYDILHLAMHAIMNDSLPMFSKLAFSPEKDSTISSPGWLYTEEIYNLKLNARLSVLSACNTGSGKLRDGEGVISLARGFFYAGCPSIVMTLWEVEDRSGAELMGEFYSLLKAGKKKNEALRLAKLKHIENANPVTAHPHVWLCYVTIGNTDALNTSNDIYFFIGILLILIVILIDQIHKNKKARKKFRA